MSVKFDPRTGAVNVKAPDVAELGFRWKELEKSLAELDKLAVDHRNASKRLRELEDSRREAETKDRAEYAAAIRSGGEDPGSPHVDEVDRKIAETRRRREALGEAIKGAAADKDATVAEHREAWRSEVEDRLPAASKRLQDAVAEVRAARSELAGLRGLHHWLADPAERFEPSQVPVNTVTILEQRDLTPRNIAENGLSELLREASGDAPA